MIDPLLYQIALDTRDRVIQERDHYLKVIVEARLLLEAGDLEGLKRVLG